MASERGHSSKYRKDVMYRKEMALCHIKVISKKAIATMEAEEKFSTGNAEQNTEDRVLADKLNAITTAVRHHSLVPDS